MKKWFALVPATLVAALSCAAALGLVIATPALAADAAPKVKGDAAAGATKAAVCGACHGATGNSVNPEWPNLAGQHPQYVTEQLAAFQAGVRANPIMYAQAIALTPQDRADLAAHFAGQTPAGLEADPSLVERGQQLFRAGDAARGVPSCMGCHGPAGRGNGPAKYPSIRSQHSLYVYNQLKAYAGNTRYVAPAEGVTVQVPAGAAIMNEIAAKLSDEDMRALASYVQGLR
jgi:cytochrome c553